MFAGEGGILIIGLNVRDLVPILKLDLVPLLVSVKRLGNTSQLVSVEANF